MQALFLGWYFICESTTDNRQHPLFNTLPKICQSSLFQLILNALDALYYLSDLGEATATAIVMVYKSIGKKCKLDFQNVVSIDGSFKGGGGGVIRFLVY